MRVVSMSCTDFDFFCGKPQSCQYELHRLRFFFPVNPRVVSMNCTDFDFFLR